MRDGRLTSLKRNLKVTRAHFNLGGDEREQPEAHRVCERIEDSGQFFGRLLGKRGLNHR
jgi:hypothetical protein